MRRYWIVLLVIMETLSSSVIAIVVGIGASYGYEILFCF
jgi:hypothetical protein